MCVNVHVLVQYYVCDVLEIEMLIILFVSPLSSVQFQEIPGTLKDSKLCVWPPYSKDPPTAFAWLTGAGVYYSTMVFGDQEPGESVFVEKNLIPYPY